MKKITTILAICLFSTLAQAQSYRDDDESEIEVKLDEIALLEVMPNSNAIVFDLVIPGSAGEEPGIALGGGTDNTKWLNYTSAVENSSDSRKIYVQISQGKVPKGIQLRLSATQSIGNGGGQRGTPSGEITLKSSPVLLINNIKGCYTGRGVNNGHRLEYKAIVIDPEKITPGTESDLEITFTMTD